MTKTIVKRLTAFVLALVMCATAFMAAGGVNVKAAGDELVDGKVYPSGTIEKDVFHFSSGCQIHFIAGNENLVPSRQELIDGFSADAMYGYSCWYNPSSNDTRIEKQAQLIYFLHNRFVPITTASGTVNYKPDIFTVQALPQRDMGETKYFSIISANNRYNGDDDYFLLQCYEEFEGISYVKKSENSPLRDIDFKVVVSFYSPACYFEVIDTWTIPFGSWTAEKAEAGQSCEEYLK